MAIEISPLEEALDEVTGGRPSKRSAKSAGKSGAQTFTAPANVSMPPLSRSTGFSVVDREKNILDQAYAYYEESGGEIQTPDGPVKLPFDEFVKAIAKNRWGTPSDKVVRDAAPLLGKEDDHHGYR